MSEQETPRTVEEAAREEAERFWPSGTSAAYVIESARALACSAFVAGATWQAARMPSVEQVRHVLTSYGVDPFDGTYGVPQYDALVDDLVALWGAL